MPASASDFLTLPPRGLTLPAAPVELALALEARGHHFKLSGDGRLLVSNPAALTASDRAALSRWAGHVAAFVEWVDAQGQQ